MGERILLVSLDNLGDLIFASALVRPLRERGFSVSLLCKDYSAAVAPLIPGLDQVFTADPFWDRAPGRPKGRLLPFLETLGRARGGAFSSAIVASRSWRARLCARACGIPRVSWLDWPVDDTRPVLEDLAPLLEVYGAPAKLSCELTAPAAAARPSVKTAALHAFAGDRRRCLPPAVFGEVAAGLRRQGWRVLWIASPAEADLLAPLLAEGDLVSADLREAAAALPGAALFIGHDSGPLHLANALGRPCVGLYLPGQPRRTFPQGRGRFVLIERPDPAGVSAGEVLAAAEGLLEAAGRGK